MADPKSGPLATPEEVKAFRAETEAEWGTYVALETITFNGALAYNPGDPVPASNVKRHGYDEAGSVAKVSTKKAQDLIASIHAATTTNAVVEQPAPVSLGVSVK